MVIGLVALNVVAFNFSPLYLHFFCLKLNIMKGDKPLAN
jgi:hypothetical protein